MIGIIIIFFIVLLGLLIIFLIRQRQSRKELETVGLATIPMGAYLTGLPNVLEANGEILASVTKDSYIFYSGEITRKEIGKIPIQAVEQISVEDKTSISQRVTLSRILVLGLFALAAPKKTEHKDFYLVIEWQDEKGYQEKTVFRFQGYLAQKSAKQAAIILKSYLQQKNSKNIELVKNQLESPR
jgi:hypothetical protein